MIISAKILTKFGTLCMLGASLAACQTSGGVQTAPVNLIGGGVGTAIRVPATMSTPGMAGVAVPKNCSLAKIKAGKCDSYEIAAVGGNGYGGDLIEAGGRIAAAAVGGALAANTGGVSAAANVTSNATAIAVSGSN